MTATGRAVMSTAQKHVKAREVDPLVPVAALPEVAAYGDVRRDGEPRGDEVDRPSARAEERRVRERVRLAYRLVGLVEPCLLLRALPVRAALGRLQVVERALVEPVHARPHSTTKTTSTHAVEVEPGVLRRVVEAVAALTATAEPLGALPGEDPLLRPRPSPLSLEQHQVELLRLQHRAHQQRREPQAEEEVRRRHVL